MTQPTTQDDETLRDYAEDERIGERIAEAMGLRRDPQHRDRWLTAAGSKTSAGVARTVRAIQRDAAY